MNKPFVSLFFLIASVLLFAFYLTASNSNDVVDFKTEKEKEVFCMLANAQGKSISYCKKYE